MGGNMDNVDDVIDAYSRLARASIDAQLKSDDTSFSNSIGLKLTKNRLLVWVNEPSELIINNDLKNKLEQILSSILYPAFVVKHKPGLTLVPRLDQPPESARALSFDLHYGIYQRLQVNSLADTNVFTNGNKLAIRLMSDYYWLPANGGQSHVSIMSSTRGGKTTLIRYLAVNCVTYAKVAVQNGAMDDGANSLVVIDPKLDADLRLTTLKLDGIYICPDFSKSDNSFVDKVCQQLKTVIDLVQQRALKRKADPSIKFKDIFVFLDEGISIPNMGNTNKNIYFRLLDRLLLMGASFQVHIIMASQSFLAGTNGAVTSQGRLEFGLKILMASRINTENAQFLFKSLDKDAINNLILDEDNYGTLGVGIIANGSDGNGNDDNIVPFKAPFVGGLE